MPTGTISRLVTDRGFGFIRDPQGIDHFFHQSSVRAAPFHSLQQGQSVEFEVEDSAKGPRAMDVKVLEDVT